jgi:hypothetical protein
VLRFGRISFQKPQDCGEKKWRQVKCACGRIRKFELQSPTGWSESPGAVSVHECCPPGMPASTSEYRGCCANRLGNHFIVNLREVGSTRLMESLKQCGNSFKTPSTVVHKPALTVKIFQEDGGVTQHS